MGKPFGFLRDSAGNYLREIKAVVVVVVVVIVGVVVVLRGVLDGGGLVWANLDGSRQALPFGKTGGWFWFKQCPGTLNFMDVLVYVRHGLAGSDLLLRLFLVVSLLGPAAVAAACEQE